MQTKYGIPINKFFKHKDYDRAISISSIVHLEGDDTYTTCVIQQNGGTQSVEYVTIKDIDEFIKGIK